LNVSLTIFISGNPIFFTGVRSLTHVFIYIKNKIIYDTASMRRSTKHHIKNSFAIVCNKYIRLKLLNIYFNGSKF